MAKFVIVKVFHKYLFTFWTVILFYMIISMTIIPFLSILSNVGSTSWAFTHLVFTILGYYDFIHKPLQ